MDTVYGRRWIRRIGNCEYAFSCEGLALIRRISFSGYGVLGLMCEIEGVKLGMFEVRILERLFDDRGFDDMSLVYVICCYNCYAVKEPYPDFKYDLAATIGCWNVVGESNLDLGGVVRHRACIHGRTASRIHVCSHGGSDCSFSDGHFMAEGRLDRSMLFQTGRDVNPNRTEFLMFDMYFIQTGRDVNPNIPEYRPFDKYFIQTGQDVNPNRTKFCPFDSAFRSKRRLYETPGLVESSSQELDLFSDIKEHSEEETTEIMTETMEQYMSKSHGNYGSGVVRPKINDKTHFELKGKYLKYIRENTFNGVEHEDVNEHIKKVHEIIELFHIPKVTQEQVMLRVFPMSLTGAAS
nr:hypothetical protein [Tanacetum cinerariifolium]